MIQTPFRLRDDAEEAVRQNEPLKKILLPRPCGEHWDRFPSISPAQCRAALPRMNHFLNGHAFLDFSPPGVTAHLHPDKRCVALILRKCIERKLTAPPDLVFDAPSMAVRCFEPKVLESEAYRLRFVDKTIAPRRRILEYCELSSFVHIDGHMVRVCDFGGGEPPLSQPPEYWGLEQLDLESVLWWKSAEMAAIFHCRAEFSTEDYRSVQEAGWVSSVQALLMMVQMLPDDGCFPGCNWCNLKDLEDGTLLGQLAEDGDFSASFSKHQQPQQQQEN